MFKPIDKAGCFNADLVGDPQLELFPEDPRRRLLKSMHEVAIISSNETFQREINERLVNPGLFSHDECDEVLGLMGPGVCKRDVCLHEEK